jgi:tetratricopeptide (TPR) repeat protein
VKKKLLIGVITAIVLIIIGAVVFNSTSSASQIKKYMTLGNKYLKEGKYEEAILAFNKVIEIEPKNIEARLELADAYIATNKFEDAEKVLREALNINKTRTEIYLKLMDVYEKTNGDAQGIISLLQTSMENVHDDRVKEKLESIIPNVPKVNVPSGKYSEFQSIKFLNLKTEEKVFYTLDNTKPTMESREYTQPIEIGGGRTTLRAILINEKGVSSKEVECEYIIDISETIIPIETSKTSETSEYIFQFSDRKILTDSEIKDLDKKLLPYARNEIFARHGYVFKNTEIKSYFESKSWYEANVSFKGASEELNEFENKNIELIQNFEENIAPNNKKDETKIAYIRDSYEKNNKNYVVIDFIEWLNSDDWEKIAKIVGFKGSKEECLATYLSNDYYIYNEKKENIVMEVAKQAEIIKLPEGGMPEPYKGTFGEFSTYHPHKIIIREGIIIKIEQYYVP